MNKIFKTVRRGTVKYKDDKYHAKFLHDLEGEKVEIDFISESINIYSEEGKYLGRAKLSEAIPAIIDEIPPKTLRTEILELIAQGRKEMEATEGHVVMNPRSLNEWATRIKELSKDIELGALARQDIQVLNMLLDMATICTAAIEEHLGKKIDELMPVFKMDVEKALKEAKTQVFTINKNTGDAATSPADTVK